jgi:hypothetical protein
MFIGYGLSFSILGLPFALLKSKRTRFALLACLTVFGVVATLETWGLPHYAAPAVPLLYLLIVQGFRGLSQLTLFRGTVARWIIRTWLVACLLFPAASLAYNWHPPVLEFAETHFPEALSRELKIWLVHRIPFKWVRDREEVIQQLRAMGGRHLVIVQYDPEHSCHEEWVYNEADIPGAKILWARAMRENTAEWNARLIEAYPGRRVWPLRVDEFKGRSIKILDGAGNRNGPATGTP